MLFSLKNILPGLAIATLLAACSTAPETTAANDPAAAEEAVLAQHDTLMARTEKIFELKAKLMAAHSPAAAPYLHGLLAADGAMMGWMHQYHAPDSAAPAAQRLAYFQQQQAQLATVEKQLTGTIDSASTFLKQGAAPAPASK